MKRLYIITGANGHLGSTIIRYLRNEDCYIRGLILPTESGEDDKKLTYYRGDVTKPESLEAIFSGAECGEAIVIHTAGLISISEGNSQQLYKVNVEGTKNVIAQCIKHGVKRLLYVSSVHAIPEKSGSGPVTEVSHFSRNRVKGAYAVTKAMATRLVLNAAEKELDAVVVHPSGIIGPYDDGKNHLVQLIKMYISGHLPAGVKGGYDFVDVRDVAKGCISAAEKGKRGECYILSNRYISVKELLEDVRSIVGGRKKLCLPIGLAKAFIPFFEWIAKVSHSRPLYTKYALYTISSGGNFSHDKATAELEYHPREFKETVRDTILWLKEGSAVLEPA